LKSNGLEMADDFVLAFKTADTQKSVGDYIVCQGGQGVAVDDDGGLAGLALSGEHGEIDIRHDHGAAGAEHHGRRTDPAAAYLLSTERSNHMTVKEVMTGITPSADYAGLEMADDFVLAFKTADTQKSVVITSSARSASPNIPLP